MPRSRSSPRYRLLRETLIAARQDAGLTQGQVAERLKSQQSFVSKYELGERRLDVVEFIEVAEALDLDPVAVIRTLTNNP